jgi:shikimate kinase
MGSGKSTIGGLLADRLGWGFVDLDTAIESAAGRPISRIFEEQGEEEFRRQETEALWTQIHRLRRGMAAVVALGGGAFARAENRELLNGNGVTIWLECPLEVARKRVEENTDRPLARDPEGFERLFRERQAVYAKADYRVPSGGEDPAEVVASILALGLL